MEKESFSKLSIKSISTIADEAKEYIGRRAAGLEKSLKVSSAKVNSVFMDGFD